MSATQEDFVFAEHVRHHQDRDAVVSAFAGFDFTSVARDSLMENVFRRSLEAFPRRYRSHLGAAEAAFRSGDPDAARYHARELLEMAGGSGERAADLARARAILRGDASS